jgi:hypothetical protein
MAPRIRREQICSRCRNHGKVSVLKNHKKLCPFFACQCEKCKETVERQNYIAKEIRFHRKKQKHENTLNGIDNALKKIPSLKLLDSTDDSTLNIACEVRRHQMCARCRNHDLQEPIKGHKNNCKFAECECEKCKITEERRKIMAKQIRENRSNKINSDEDDGYGGSPTESPETELQFPSPGDRSPPRLQIIEDMSSSSSSSSSNEMMTDEKDMFYIVQSLYEKCFMQNDSKSRFEVLYAFVMMTGGNWELINHSLSQGMSTFQVNGLIFVRISIMMLCKI